MRYTSEITVRAAGSSEVLCQPVFTSTCDVKAGDVWGTTDFFGLGPMSGGLSELAWLAKGLPLTADLELELRIHDVLGA